MGRKEGRKGRKGRKEGRKGRKEGKGREGKGRKARTIPNIGFHSGSKLAPRNDQRDDGTKN